MLPDDALLAATAATYAATELEVTCASPDTPTATAAPVPAAVPAATAAAPRPSSSSSNKSLKRSKSDSPSGSAKADAGYDAVSERLRSVLFDRRGLPLACYLAGGDAFLPKVSEVFPDITRALQAMPSPSQQDNDESNSLLTLDNILCKSYEHYLDAKNKPLSQSKVTERTFTQKLGEFMELVLERFDVNVNHQITLRDGAGGCCFPDLLVCQGNEKDNGTALLLIEVGFNNDDWWAKLHQSVRYLQEMLKQNAKNLISVSKPLLLAVLTISDDKMHQVSDDKHAIQSKLGVFLCAKKHDDFRMALLWRTEETLLEDLTLSFGRILRVAVCLSKLNAPSESDVDFVYLGPNCCRIGEWVYRSFDNRLRISHRRSDIYMNKELMPQVSAVCELTDKYFSTLQRVPSETHCTRPEKRGHLWDFEGRLLIISTPFHHGLHWATSPKEFIPIMKQLQKLHDKGYVHGDIRSFNIVFNPNGGTLIDFDFGGKISHADAAAACGPKYPTGYVRVLPDGSRRGFPGMPITTQHDWSALLKVIFHCHKFHPPADGGSEEETRDIRADIGELQTAADEHDPSPETIEKLIAFLNKVEVRGWTVTPSPEFEEYLRYVELYPEKGTIAKQSDVASGSPDKKNK